jgi:hypothetical protein
MATSDNDEKPDNTDRPEEDTPAETETEAPVLDRGLAPPSEVPEITSTHPLDRGLAPPDDENGEGKSE